MTTDEIKALVAKKLAGQGTNVDAASVLPTIINALCDAVDAAEAAAAAAAALAPKVIYSEASWDEIPSAENYDTKASLALALGILEESEVDDLPSCDELKFTDASVKRTSTIRIGDWEYIIIFGGSDGTGDFGFAIVLERRDSGYHIKKVEL